MNFFNYLLYAWTRKIEIFNYFNGKALFQSATNYSNGLKLCKQHNLSNYNTSKLQLHVLDRVQFRRQICIIKIQNNL